MSTDLLSPPLLCVIEANLTRREFIVGGVSLAALLAACGPTAVKRDETQTEGYPRTLTDAGGNKVTLQSRPTRVATVANLWDLDALLSLGVAPVQFGVRDGFEEMTGSETGSWEWHEKALNDLGANSERVILGDSISLERLAAAKPDLILGDEMVVDVRRELEAIAPVIQIAFFDWRRNLRMLGEALNLDGEAGALIEQTDGRMAEALKGLDVGNPKVALIAAYDTSIFYGLGHSSIPSVDMFERAGFTQLDALKAGATKAKPRPEFSVEQADILEPADVLVVFDFGSAGIDRTPVFQALSAVKEGRVVVLQQGPVAQGFSTLSPLNLDVCLEVVRTAAGLLDSSS